MDPGPQVVSAGQAAGGLYLPLSDSEQKCYSELFSLCQVEGSSRLAADSSKVAELFMASQLPAETLHQVSPKWRGRSSHSLTYWIHLVLIVAHLFYVFCFKGGNGSIK